MSQADWLDKDFYKVLGVSKKADAAEIKKSYRKLARELHPDTNPDPKAEDKFKAVSEAYDVLGNAERRKEYDQVRAMGPMGSRLSGGGPGGGFGRPGDAKAGLEILAVPAGPTDGMRDYGIANLDFKRHAVTGEYRLLEINPRQLPRSQTVSRVCRN